MKTVKIVAASGKEYTIPQKAVAHINSKKCVNCNECREACPVGAIEENQRIICHACPECTEKPGISPKKFVALATEKSCTTACPLGISPQGYVNLVKAGKEKEAFEIIWKKNPLAEVCGSICHHPCEQACKRGILIDRPIEIRNMKKYLAQNNSLSFPKYQRMYDETIAIIGAGPAGLTAGHYLAQAGYRVTIFESDKEAGGMLLHGIPKFRLDRDVVRKEIKALEEAGLEIRYGEQINKYSMQAIMTEYDAVIVAAGTPKSRELLIEGFRTEGIFPAMKYMEMVNAEQKVRHHLGQMYVEKGEVVVVGGGSIAIDAARTALRQGASKVTVVSSETYDQMPAHQWEIDEAKEEGILFEGGWTPKNYIYSAVTKLDGIHFEQVTDCGKDEDGKFFMNINHEVTKNIKADLVILAIGNMAESYWKEFEDVENVFWAGDIASGKCSVVDAMASGRTAALAADAYIRKREVRDPMDNHVLVTAEIDEKIYPYNLHKMNRPVVEKISMEDRTKTFKEVEKTFTAEEAHLESMACVACGFQKVDPDKCIGCGICKNVCPKGDVITMVPLEGDVK
ncbi:MAG: FAD-dependent oxidoreductase [Lachnospiraceae bacterium]